MKKQRNILFYTTFLWYMVRVRKGNNVYILYTFVVVVVILNVSDFWYGKNLTFFKSPCF